MYLVGAGPGNAGLLTLRGAELLGRADVVVYDALVNKELLRMAPETARRQRRRSAGFRRFEMGGDRPNDFGCAAIHRKNLFQLVSHCGYGSRKDWEFRSFRFHGCVRDSNR